MTRPLPRRSTQRPRTRVWVAVACAVAAAAGLGDAGTTAAAGPGPRLMPKYKIQGEPIVDPAQIAQERKQFEAAYGLFKQAAADYQREVKEYISRDVSERQKKVGSTYQAQIDKLDQEQFDLRREAIARLEGFVFRHRDHPRYTPDSLFRLAELYYEDTIAAYNRATDNFMREMDLYNRGKLLDPPTDAKRDFSRSIAIYKYLHWVPPGTPMEPLSGKLAGLILDATPEWRNNKDISPAAMYLQGFCEYEMRELDPKYEARAIATLSSIEEQYPTSKHIPEAWLRVGEIQFDNNEYEKAAAAYERAATKAKEMGDNENYSLALYKLGWSNFQLYKYSEAVRWFQTLIEFEDDFKTKEAALPEKDKKKLRFDLRKEAIEYLAKSLAEPSWDDDPCDDFGSETTKGECPVVDPRARPILYTASVLDPTLPAELSGWQAPFKGEVLAGIQRNFKSRNDVRVKLMNGRPYVYEILRTYGETLFAQREDEYYWQAVRILSYTLDNYPMVREAQDMQRKVIQSLDILAGRALSYEKEIESGKGGPDAKIGLEMANEAKARQIIERKRYLSQFGRGSEWYKKWGSDKDLAAQVDDFTAKIRYEFAMLNHAEAQRLKAAGKFEESSKKYAEAAAAYEELLAADKDHPNAYKLTWTLAETWYWAGFQCNGPRDKDQNLLMVDDEVVPYPADKVPTIKAACGNMQKSIDYYNRIREWKGQRTKGEDGKPLDYTEEAAWSAIWAAELVLSARSAYPVGDPERIQTMSLPELRPSSKQDDADLKAAESLKEVKKVVRLTVDPLAVEWILAADGYVAVADKLISKDDPKRAEKLSLKAAELLYKNRHFDPWKEGATPRTPPEFWSARLRFETILKKFPGTKAAEESLKNLVQSYNMERDLETLSEVVTKYKDKLDPKVVKEVFDTIGQIKFNAKSDRAFAMFQDAEAVGKQAEASTDPDQTGKLLELSRKKYAKAADDFRGVREDVMGVEKMPMAERIKLSRTVLLNSVRAYKRAEQWDKCLEVLHEAETMLREWKPTKADEKAEQVKAVQEVLEIRAELNYKFFKIEATIADFVLLYQNDVNGPKADYYLNTAAQMAFFNSNWDKAVELNREIISRFEKSSDLRKVGLVKDAMWQIQVIYKAKGDIAKQIEALEAFILRYSGDKSSSPKVFRAYAMIAEIYEGRGDKVSATRMYNRIIDAFVKGGFDKNGGPEAAAAAAATFNLMKPRYDAFMTTRIVENPRLPASKRMPDLIAQVKKVMDVLLGPEVKIKAPDGSEVAVRCGDCPPGNAQCRTNHCKPDPKVNGLYDEYLTAVATYGSQNWSYAAFLLRARLLKYFARSIYDAPRPPDLTPEETEAYEEFLESLGKKFEDRAIKSLKVALDDAEAKGVVNAWVTELRSEMNKYKPKDYPLLRDEKRLEAGPAGTLPQVEKELR